MATPIPATPRRRRPPGIGPRCRVPPKTARRDTGSVTVELALAVLLLTPLVFLIIGAFHLGRAVIDVNSAAAAASRAASLSRTASTATTAADNAATANLAGRCARLHVTVDTSNFHRGGTVTVTVACTVTTGDLIGGPGSLTPIASSTSPLDVYSNITP